MGNMDIWYARLTEEQLMGAISTLTEEARSNRRLAQVRQAAKRARKSAQKAHTRDSLQRCPSLRSRRCRYLESSVSRPW